MGYYLVIKMILEECKDMKRCLSMYMEVEKIFKNNSILIKKHTCVRARAPTHLEGRVPHFSGVISEYRFIGDYFLLTQIF